MARSRSARSDGDVRVQHLYLIQYSYTSHAWDALLKGKAASRDRIKAVEKLVQKLGGCFPTITLPCMPDARPREKFGSFGDYDVVTLIAFPSDEAAAAFAMAISAGGAVSTFKTTKLLTWDEMTSAMGLAATTRNDYESLK